MKVLLLTDGIYPFVIGGMQKHSYNLAKILTQKGVKVSLVHCVNDEEDLPTTEEVNQALFNGAFQLEEIIALKFPKKGKVPGHYIRNSYQYATTIYEAQKEKLDTYDIIYAQGFTGWKILQQKQEFNTPVYLNFHGLNMFQQSAGIKAALEFTMLRSSVRKNIELADVNVSLGGKLTNIIEGINSSSPVLVSYNGIDEKWVKPTAEKRSEDSVLKFIFIGRYDKIKGLNELNAVVREIEKEAAFEIHFIGPIPAEHAITSSKAIYHGTIKDEEKIISVLDDCDVLVSPSYSEGMPTVINEAMARGLAIIATDVGAVAEQVDESNGWLVKVADKVNLRNSMLAAINDSTLINKKMKSIEKVKSQYLWTSILDKFLKDVERLKSIG